MSTKSEINNNPEGDESTSRASIAISEVAVEEFLKKNNKELGPEARAKVEEQLSESVHDALETLPILIAMNEVDASSPQEMENLKFLQMLKEKYNHGIEIEVSDSGIPFTRVLNPNISEDSFIVSKQGVYNLGRRRDVVTQHNIENLNVSIFLDKVKSEKEESRSNFWFRVSGEELGVEKAADGIFKVLFRETPLGDESQMKTLSKSLDSLERLKEKDVLLKNATKEMNKAERAFSLFKE